MLSPRSCAETSQTMVLLHVAMSLDGFIAGPGHDMSWTGRAEYDTSSHLADEVARSTGVVLAGRGWYEVASADEGGAVAGIYGGAWSGPVLVLTHHPEQLASDRTVEACGVRESRSHAAKPYSWISPPSRFRRSRWSGADEVASRRSGRCGSGATRLSARWG